MTISLIQTCFVGVTTHSSVKLTMVGPLFGYIYIYIHIYILKTVGGGGGGWSDILPIRLYRLANKIYYILFVVWATLTLTERKPPPRSPYEELSAIAYVLV